jgi:O-methyltransferase
MISHQGASSWKLYLFNLISGFMFKVPMISEFINQGLRRNFELLSCWHFLSRVGVEGDYAEFGVFRGDTFKNMMIASRTVYKGTLKGEFTGSFHAFDSFEGLPDSTPTSSNIFKKGEFRSSRKFFEKNIQRARGSFNVNIIEGWFNQTLSDSTAKTLNITKLAFVNIDCDIYESTIDVLNFITPHLQTGSILYFDDWFSCKGNMLDGEPLACSEWLYKNPKISLHDFRNIGVLGKAFIVNIKD